MTENGSGVILVTELFPPTVGGSAVLFANIYSRLRTLDVVLITEEIPLPEGHAYPFTQTVRMQINRHTWTLLNGISFRRYIGLARAIAAQAAKRPGIAHCARALPEGVSALIARRLMSGPPYVCWTHGEELVTYSTSRELTMLRRAVHRGAAAIVANSQNTKRMLERSGVHSSRIHVVYPGVDADRFAAPTSASVKEDFGWQDKCLVLTIGRLQRRKGHDFAIEAIARLRTSHPHVRYLIVGKGDEERRLRELIATHDIGEHVRIIGEVSEAELPRYYASADIFLHPNRIDEDGDVEGFGIVFLEAAAAGLPTIGGASGGVPEAVEQNVTGLLVSGRDVEEIATAIKRLVDSAELRVRLGTAGRARVRKAFTWEKAAADLAMVHLTVARNP
jgi:phosphatidyl-myo-inositol dimannoside synthase